MQRPTLTAALTLLLATQAHAQFWTTQTIANNFAEVDFAIDQNGTLHVLYTTIQEEEVRDLHYAQNPGTGWQHEPVTTDVDWSLVSIAVDPQGIPHISYIDTNGDVQYATRPQTTWTFETPPPLIGPNHTYFPSIALDSTGEPHIAYQTYGERIRHAYRDQGTWHDEEVDGSFLDISQSRVAMAIGPNDELHIAGWHYFDGAAFFTRGAESWTYETFGQWGYMPWVALDNQGNAHFTYYGPGTHYATNKTTTWTTDPIEPDTVHEDNDIAIDHNGQPALTRSFPVGLYFQPPDFIYETTTYFCYQINGEWRSETVETSEEYANYYRGISRLAFDQDNVPHIVFRDPATDDLRHAVRLAPTATDPTPVSTSTRLLAVSPNPFNPRTEVSFEVGEAGPISVAVYDAAGRLIRVLAQGHREPGKYAEMWDGRDRHGRWVASGVYHARLTGGGSEHAVKLVLVR